MQPTTQVDHLVVAADTLQQGARWCESTLGVTPQAGGKHALMATHNQVLKIASPGFPHCYLEIIAIDPEAGDPGRVRWFGLDRPELRDALRESPRLVHIVARTQQARAAMQAWSPLGIDAGRLLEAQRQTANGLLQWRISVRDDGQPQFDGALPTLIEWRGHHPAESLPDSGLQLETLTVQHPRAVELERAFAAVGLSQAAVQAGEAELVATLRGPRGELRIASR